MKKITLIAFLCLIVCLACSGVYGQEPDRIELDASGFHSGQPLRFNVSIDSLENLSFADARTRLTAILCPAGGKSGACQVMSLAPDADDSTSMKVTFAIESLPQSGDFTLDVSFLDETGAFETTTAAFLLRGVQEADPAAAGSVTEEVTETPAAEEPSDPTAEATEAPLTPAEESGTEIPSAEETAEPAADEPSETPNAEETDIPETEGTEEPLPEEETSAETEAVPLTVAKAVLRPEVRDGAGNTLIYGSTVYVGQDYFLRLNFDRPLNESVTLEALLPASLLSAPIDPASECMQYLNADGTAWEIPGGLLSEGSFSCSLRFSNNIWLAANPFVFSLKEAAYLLPGITETFEMDRLSWTNYPVNVTKVPATHQLMVSDSRGNLICSDNAACARFGAEDVYIMNYSLPASWGAALPSGKDLSVTIQWPEAWANSFAASEDMALAEAYGRACTVDWEGKTTLTLEETSPGRYKASCAFVPSGITNPVQAKAVVHLNDNSFALNDLNVWMPANIVKTQAVLTPSLTLRMAETSAGEEQIRGGSIGTLYRTSRDYPNSFDGNGAPALYTLKAEVSGISSVRTPQYGDQVVVKWPLLDSLARTGDLPSCLVPTGDGYVLGSLMQMADGTWHSSCDFRFPRTMDTSVNGTQMEMTLYSGVYQTSAKVQMNGAPFKNETLYVDLDVPEHMFLGQPTDFHIRLSDSSGGFSDYMKAVLEADGVTLNSSWIYNSLTTCGGVYTMNVDGTSECSVIFSQPVTEASDMHFDLITSSAGSLFDVVYRPSADIHVLPITNIKASLSVKLFHAGEEISLPASDSDAFMVGDDYQLKFYLTPDPEFQDVVNAISVDYEGMVLDWFEPLLIRWEAIPNGQIGLNFYRDGGSFTASYEFSFSQGNLYLDGNMGRLTMEPYISGWDITVMNGYEPIALPSHVERHPLSLEISDFTVSGSTEPVRDLIVEQEADFSIKFNGSLDAFDPLQLMVGYDANGIHTPVSCAPDYSAGELRCSLTAQCTDYTAGGDYSPVCGTNLSLYAVYNGDTMNDAAEAEPKTYSVKRQTLNIYPSEEGSLSAADVRSVQGVSDDLMSMGRGTLSVGGWLVDTYIPRQIRNKTSQDYCSYPVIFRYDPLPSGQLDQNSLWLDVAITTGTKADPREETISLRPRMVTDNMIMFELDFGSYEMLDDGRIVKDVLENAVEIRSLKARYIGSPLVAAASCSFEAQYLEFALKVATVLETELDLSFPGILSFGGIFASEALMQSFDVHCSQLYQDLQCSTEAPADVVVYDFVPEPTAVPLITSSEVPNADPDAGPDEVLPIEEITEAPAVVEEYQDFPATGTAALNFNDEGCWGKIKTSLYAQPQIFVNNAAAPICYLSAWNENRQIWIATNGDL